jgi:hypothetical protein
LRRKKEEMKKKERREDKKKRRVDSLVSDFVTCHEWYRIDEAARSG